jgi:hypothetical protein
MTATLTDRYVWAVVRTAPEKQRPELEREVRALVADATDARLDAGSTTAEHDAIVELGDPQVLAARYADRPLTLIGPQYYLVWLRLLKLLLAIVVPLGAIGIGIGQFVAQAEVGGIIGAMIGGAITITVHVCFWTTAVFALIDRGMGGSPMMEWTPDQLPEVPVPARRSALGELIGSVVWLAVVLAAVVWQQFNPYLTDAGSLPILNPDLWTFWIPWFIVLILAEVVIAIVAYSRGWSYPLAGINVLLNAAFAVPAIWLVATGALLNPAFVDAVARETDGDLAQVWDVTTAVILIAIIVICVWDVVDGFLKAYRARNPLLAPVR